MNTCLTDYLPGDGSLLSTEALQRAIDVSAESGGGCVTVPAGLYVIGTVYLKSHTALYLEAGAVLKGSDSLGDYNDVDAFPQNSPVSRAEEWVGKHMILCLEQEDVCIFGDGIIDGNGASFFEAPKAPNFEGHGWKDGFALAKDKVNLRPSQMICFVECRDVRVRDVKLQNSPCWTLFFHGCENVQVRGIRIENPPYNANTDGMDIDCCRYVTVSDCIVDTGDDALAIRCNDTRLKTKRITEYITVSNCVLTSSSCVCRIGVGNGSIRHVLLNDIVSARGGRALSVITNYNGHGSAKIEDVTFDSIRLSDSVYPYSLVTGNEGYLKNIVFRHVRATSDNGVLPYSLTERDGNIVFDDCVFDVK